MGPVCRPNIFLSCTVIFLSIAYATMNESKQFTLIMCYPDVFGPVKFSLIQSKTDQLSDLQTLNESRTIGLSIYHNIIDNEVPQYRLPTYQFNIRKPIISKLSILVSISVNISQYVMMSTLCCVIFRALQQFLTYTCK